MTELQIDTPKQWSIERDLLPTEIRHNDGSKITITNNENAVGTYGVEYKPCSPSKRTVNLNREDYYKDSFDFLQHAIDDVKRIINSHD